MLNKSAMLRLTLAAASLMGAANLALAATATASLGVSASVSKSCSISTEAIAFGAYDPIVVNATVALDATGAVVVACTKKSTGVTIGLSNGGQPSGAQRRLVGTDATNLLSYDLYQPSNNTPGAGCGTTAWSDTSTLLLSEAPSKEARTYKVCGSIPAGLDAVADTYTDTVTATINF